MSRELDGMVAIVTGGAGGLGRGMVECFAEEGASVVVADVNAEGGEALASGLGDTVAFKQTDVSDADQIQDVVDFAVERFGGLHVMCNNAGLGGSFAPFLKDDFADFDRSIAVNLYGVMIGCQRAARHMAGHGGGVIVNTTSIGGITAGAGVMVYRATKAAVIHMTRSLAIELAPKDIRVNCIAPAHIPTAINENLDQSLIIKAMQPLQRQGSPRDVGNAAVFLASDRAAQITGIVLPVDGGTTAGPPPRRLEDLKKQ
ncbi:MAG TPA: SDR family oxidoreductase [Acidimicrobiia bacterium]|nr:SDR family oxidoreductase [Acidimicrobiia bacterium]